MNTSTPIFKFATIRAPKDTTNFPAAFNIQPSTAFVNSLIEIIESEQKQPEKIRAMNQKLETLIKSESFFKTKFEVAEAVSKVMPPDARLAEARSENTNCSNADEESTRLYETLYDNIVARTLTKSANQEVFKVLIDNIKRLHERIGGTGDVRTPDAQRRWEPRVVLPERLVISFSPPPPPREETAPPSDQALTHALAQLQDLTEQKRRLQQSIAEYATQIAAEREKLQREQMQAAPVLSTESRTATDEAAQAARISRVEETQRAAEANPALEQLVATSERLKASEKEISISLTELSHSAFKLFPQVKYAYIGDKWTDITRLDETRPPKIEDETIFVYSQGCYLKFPFQVADLRVVKQQSVGYVPDRISHINNTLPGELNERTTLRTESVVTFESLITEDETSRETDTQSTQQLTLSKAASEVQAEESSFNINTSVSGTYGVVTAALDAGYSNSQSTQNANSSAQSYAKEIVERVVERTSNKVRQERNSTRLQEFKEKVKHVIDNTKATGPKTEVFRWLLLLIHATVENYGLRLILKLDLPHLGSEYISRSIKEQPGLNLPQDPRELKAAGRPFFQVESITRENYLAWAEMYHAKLEPPPETKIIVSYTNSGKAGENSEKLLNPLPDGYCAVYAFVERTFIGQANDKGLVFGFISVLVGRTGIGDWIIPTSPSAFIKLNQLTLNRETKFLPISIVSPFGNGYAVNIEIECELTAEGEKAWQVKCYNAILEAYDALKAQAENKMSGFDPNQPGLNPTKKREIIKTELKKGALSRMFRCNPFWISDEYVVGQEYDPDCCKDTLNAEKVRFIENTCDWDNITYELHPYLYADKDNWAGLLNLTDDDPHFEAFLQSSYATVHIPVYRDSLKETAAVNFILYNTIANYQVVPAAMQPLLDELSKAEPTKFTTGLNGEELPVPVEVVDIGIFPVATDLVILECGVENGVKPIGFPQAEADETGITIPKQYSPAIISDPCPAPINQTPTEEGPPNP